LPDDLVQALGREVQGIIGLTVVKRAAGLISAQGGIDGRKIEGERR
jgi:hypothetical protein